MTEDIPEVTLQNEVLVADFIRKRSKRCYISENAQ